MNKEEKKLAKKILAGYNGKDNSSFTPDENKLIAALIVHGKLNKDAFFDVTSTSSRHREYLLGVDYPFTALGEEERNKSWYFEFRNSKTVIIIRDILNLAAFSISLYLAITKTLQP